MKLKIILPAAFLSVLLSSCWPCAKELSDPELNEKFGTAYNYNWNGNKTYLLAINKSSGKKPSQSFEFFIYNPQTDAILLKEVYPGGSAEWIDTYKIKVEIIPGNITGDETEEDFRFIYDVKLNKKITK